MLYLMTQGTRMTKIPVSIMRMTGWTNQVPWVTLNYRNE